MAELKFMVFLCGYFSRKTTFARFSFFTLKKIMAAVKKFLGYPHKNYVVWNPRLFLGNSSFLIHHFFQGKSAFFVEDCQWIILCQFRQICVGLVVCFSIFLVGGFINGFMKLPGSGHLTNVEMQAIYSSNLK